VHWGPLPQVSIPWLGVPVASPEATPTPSLVGHPVTAATVSGPPKEVPGAGAPAVMAARTPTTAAAATTERIAAERSKFN
jgi:hypothetical protein